MPADHGGSGTLHWSYRPCQHSESIPVKCEGISARTLSSFQGHNCQ